MELELNIFASLPEPLSLSLCAESQNTIKVSLVKLNDFQVMESIDRGQIRQLAVQHIWFGSFSILLSSKVGA